MKNIFRVIKISRPLYGIIALLSGLIVVGAMLELLSPIISKLIVDEIVSKIAQKGGDFNRLIFLIAMVFVANFIGIVVTSLSDRLGDHFGGKLRQLLTEKFYNHILRLPQSYFDSEMSGKIVNQLARGISTIQNFINTSTNFILPTFLQSIFTIVILAKYNWPTALFTFLLFPVYLAISTYSSKRWGQEEVKKNIHEDLSRSRIQEVISNIKIVKGFGTEKREYSFVSEEQREINNIYARQSTTFHLFDFARNFSLNIILLIINVIVFYNTYLGLLTIGEMVLILQLIAQARRPLFAMSFILTQIQNAEAGSKEFFEILALPSTENFDSQVATRKLKDPTLEFKDVSFGYSESEKVLKSISFQIAPQETVALVGPSGAGKTTIINLILKFYEASSGEIFLKGKSYQTLTHHDVRNNIALVFQENELFSATIKENVAYGTQSTEDEVKEALKLANAWDFVSALPKGLDSEVGERGVRLSGGQKQRIQIARAILRNTPILILDEATSNLDARSEKEVQDALAKLMKDKLVIVIAHRFSTLQNVDKVIVLNKGVIEEYGTPKDLANRPGIYADLLKFQIEGNKKLLEGFELY